MGALGVIILEIRGDLNFGSDWLETRYALGWSIGMPPNSREIQCPGCCQWLETRSNVSGCPRCGEWVHEDETGWCLVPDADTRRDAIGMARVPPDGWSPEAWAAHKMANWNMLERIAANRNAKLARLLKTLGILCSVVAAWWLAQFLGSWWWFLGGFIASFLLTAYLIGVILGYMDDAQLRFCIREVRRTNSPPSHLQEGA